MRQRTPTLASCQLWSVSGVLYGHVRFDPEAGGSGFTYFALGATAAILFEQWLRIWWMLWGLRWSQRRRCSSPADTRRVNAEPAPSRRSPPTSTQDMCRFDDNLHTEYSYSWTDEGVRTRHGASYPHQRHLEAGAARASVKTSRDDAHPSHVCGPRAWSHQITPEEMGSKVLGPHCASKTQSLSSRAANLPATIPAVK